MRELAKDVQKERTSRIPFRKVKRECPTVYAFGDSIFLFSDVPMSPSYFSIFLGFLVSRPTAYAFGDTIFLFFRCTHEPFLSFAACPREHKLYSSLNFRWVVANSTAKIAIESSIYFARLRSALVPSV